MLFNVLIVAVLCAACYALGRFHSAEDDLQHLIDLERLKRETQGMYRIGDEKTERGFFDPVVDRDEINQ